MLCAYDRQTRTVWATLVGREDGPFLCPVCQECVILKQGRVKIAHFAHRPASECTYAGQGESEEHRTVKVRIYTALQQSPDVSDVVMERALGEIRPDVSFRHCGELKAIEVQISTLSRDDIERRTEAYARRNIAVLWTPPLPLGLFEERYAPRDWERYVHGLYYGAVYYWSEDLLVQPVKFEEYLLPPSRYSDEKRSKRFVTPALYPSCSILDLTPRWRKAWRSYPRAKLLMEPWSS